MEQEEENSNRIDWFTFWGRDSGYKKVEESNLAKNVGVFSRISGALTAGLVLMEYTMFKRAWLGFMEHATITQRPASPEDVIYASNVFGGLQLTTGTLWAFASAYEKFKSEESPRQLGCDIVLIASAWTYLLGDVVESSNTEAAVLLQFVSISTGLISILLKPLINKCCSIPDSSREDVHDHAENRLVGVQER